MKVELTYSQIQTIRALASDAKPEIWRELEDAVETSEELKREGYIAAACRWQSKARRAFACHKELVTIEEMMAGFLLDA